MRGWVYLHGRDRDEHSVLVGQCSGHGTVQRCGGPVAYGTEAAWRVTDESGSRSVGTGNVPCPCGVAQVDNVSAHFLVFSNESAIPLPPPASQYIEVLSDGVCRLRGTDGDDHYVITPIPLEDEDGRVVGQDGIRINGEVDKRGPFTQLIFDGLGGNDSVTFESVYVPPPPAEEGEQQEEGTWLYVNADVDFKGGPGNDTLTSTVGTAVIHGGPGNDTIRGGDGNDSLYGDEGNDTIYGYGGEDLIDGGLGADTLDGGSGIDHLLGGRGDDTISGGDDNDRIEGGEGNDTIDAGTGDDVVFGGAGSDIIIGDAGNDRLYVGASDTDTGLPNETHTVDGGSGSSSSSAVRASIPFEAAMGTTRSMAMLAAI